MRILLTNDDGIHGEGLAVLEKIARTFTDDVWVVASELDQSGSSHSLTLRDPLRVREVDHQKFAISGTPTDCVLIAVTHLLKDKKPDLILSGINYGENLAEDVTYSGTIAAAMEGTLLGIRSVALSMNIRHMQPAKWETALHHAPDILKKIIGIDLPQNVFLNVNFPNAEIDTLKGIRVTTQGQRQGVDMMSEHKDPRGKSYYWIGAAMYRYDPDPAFIEPGTDLEAIYDGYISITPICLNLTHTASLDAVSKAFNI